MIIAVLCAGGGYWLGRSSNAASSPKGGSGTAARAFPKRQGGESATAPTASGNAIPALAPEEITRQARAALREPDRIRRLKAFTAVLDGMTVDNWKAISEAVMERYSSGGSTHPEAELGQIRQGQVLGAASMDNLPAEPNGKVDFVQLNRMQGWASADPRAAREWIEALEPGRVKDSLLSRWKQGLSEARPDIVAGLFPTLPAADQRAAVGSVLSGLIEEGGVSAARAWYENPSSIADPTVRQEAFARLLNRMTQGPENWDAAFAFMKSQASSVDLGAVNMEPLLRRVAPTQPGKCLDLLDDLAKSSPSLLPQLDGMIDATVENSTTSSLNTLATWLDTHRDHPLFDRTVSRFALRTSTDDAEAALHWAGTISDGKLRAETLAALKGE